MSYDKFKGNFEVFSFSDLSFSNDSNQRITPRSTDFVAIGAECYVNIEDGTIWLRMGLHDDTCPQRLSPDDSPKFYEELKY